MQINRRWMAVLWLVLGAAIASGQPAADDFGEVPTIQSLIERRDALLDSQQSARDLYTEAIARLQRVRASFDAASAFKAEIAAAPNRLESIREELLRPAVQPSPQPPADATLVQLEQAEAEASATLAAARALESQLQAETTTRQSRRVQIQDELPLLRQQLVVIEESLRSAFAEDADAAIVDARRAELAAHRAELLARIDELDAERASYDARRDLLPARRDLAARRVVEAVALAGAWRDLVAGRRQQEAERSAREADRLRRETARQHPTLRAYAEVTQRLAQERTKPDAIPQRIDRASQQVAETRGGFTSLQQRYTAVRQRISTSGLDRATGLMLRREFETLPDIEALRKQAARVDQDLEDIEFLLFERRDLRAGSDDINRVRQQLLDQLDQETLAQPGIESVATELATARRDVLAELENDADRFQDILVDLDRDSQRLLEAALQYESFVRERILWVRSIPSRRGALLTDFRASRDWLFDGREWLRGWSHTRTWMLTSYTTGFVAVAVLALLVAGSRWSKRRIKEIAESVGRYRTDSFGLTISALCLTLLRSSPLPVAVWLVGGALSRPTDQVLVAESLGIGLQTAAYPLFVLTFARFALRSSGLADAHFRWPERSIRRIRGQLRWYTPVIALSVVVVAMARHNSNEPVVASLGRLGFTVAMVASTAFLVRVLSPSGPVLREWLKQRESGWLDRLRYIWYPLLVAIPITLAILSWLGYFYTAIQLERRIETSIALALFLVLANAMLLRWLFLARRRVSVEEARRRREQAVAAEASGQKATESGPTESSIPPLDEDKLDLPSISLQTKQLFSTMIWLSAVLSAYLVWADVLPALRMLDRIEVYPGQRIIETRSDDHIEVFESPTATRTTEAGPVAGETAQAAQNDQAASAPVPLPGSGQPSGPASSVANGVSVTIADVGLAAVVLVATFVAFRNLPGLIEIVVLQRLPLDSGSRYALSTVLKYSITIIGVAAALSALEIAWSNVQWLAAALTFGLAFGLQEIFANFISGLIILAERPIRIGDTVTAGNVSGTVTRIRMRATTITDWDRKELVIPNKTFITNDVINWTLSDPTLRVIVPVGVSYSADVRKAEALLLQIADDAPNVLGEPKPYVVFGKFGDSTLDFELRVFIAHVDHVLTVRHHLHMRITEVFREADIEIAFPQRDLHLRSIGDLRELIAPTNEAMGRAE